MIEMKFTALSASLNAANWEVKARQPDGGKDMRLYGSDPELPGKAPNELVLRFEHGGVNALKKAGKVAVVLKVRDRQDLKFLAVHAIGLVPDEAADQEHVVARERHENVQFLYALATDTDFVVGALVGVEIDLTPVV